MPDALTFAVLALASFRLQRIVTTDDWPPSEWFRDRVGIRTGEDSGWFTLATCAWCFGLWISAAVMAEHHYLSIVPMWVYGIFAVSAIVGLLAEWSSE